MAKLACLRALALGCLSTLAPAGCGSDDGGAVRKLADAPVVFIGCTARAGASNAIEPASVSPEAASRARQAVARR